MQIMINANANQVIANELHEKSTAAYFKSLITDVNNRYETRFATDMQIYVTRLGIIASKAVTGRHITANTYLGSIDFLCNTLLKNSNLYNMLRAIEVNSEGNSGKHSAKNIKTDIEECVRQYNRLIRALVDIGLDAFSICYVKLHVVDYRDRKVFKERYEEKFGILEGTKFKVTLSRNVQLDPYTKTVAAKLNISWVDCMEDQAFVVEVFSNDQLIEKKENIDLTDPRKSVDIIARVNEDQLDRRKLTLKVRLTLMKGEKQWYSTGILFWKEYHSYKTPKKAGSTEIVVSIIV